MAKQVEEPKTAEWSRSQLYRGVAELALLLLLKDARRYGLELLDRLKAETGVEIADGTIYPLLHRLERQGLVAAEWVNDTPNGRPRKYYAATGAGRDRLEDMLADWRQLAAAFEKLAKGNP